MQKKKEYFYSKIGEENVLRLEKGKRGLLNVLFGRSMMCAFLLLIQFLLMFSLIAWLGAKATYGYALGMLVGFIVVIHVVNREGNMGMKITWILLMTILPVFGIGLYVWIQLNLGHRLMHQELQKTIEETKEYVSNDPQLLEKIEEEDVNLHRLVRYLDDHGNFPVYDDTASRYLASGEEYFEVLLEELEKAEKFIFMEYFIVQEGYMWGRVLDILKRKVDQGVEVKIIYDGGCAVSRLPYSYPEKLKKLGIQCKMFAPPKPVMSTHYNNRDHRKIVVIDGKTGFCGGVNLSDEYINRKTLYGHWKDTGLVIYGEAVRSMTLMFLQIWNMTEKDRKYKDYIYSSPVVKNPGHGYVIPYADSPLDNERVGEMVYMDIINKANYYVHITTPYLIIENEMLSALCFAAKRGVDVKLILPHIPDKEYAFALAKTHYKELIKAGVKIYEYLPGFIHAKSFVSDDKHAVVGSINLDYRSLYLSFENAVYLYKTASVRDIEKDFQSTLAKCMRATEETMKKEKLSRKVLGLILKVFAPLM